MKLKINLFDHRKLLRNKIENALIILFIILVLYMFVTLWIQMFKCPELTQTQLLLNIPNSLMLKFKIC